MKKNPSAAPTSSTQNAHDHKLSQQTMNKQNNPSRKKTKQSHWAEKVSFFVPEEAEKVAVVGAQSTEAAEN